ncbi:MAG TPA: sulfotransferase [Verrucomicrobiae bacterium]|nr:sulfotransferase [Verrucomicrobiae bacterium]
MSDDFVTIVSGLPRSGTSLMMQMLQAGGMPLLTDGQRAPDEHNPRGYFEHESVKHSQKDLSWLQDAKEKAVKVIHLLLTSLPTDRDYRVLFMLRDLEEVIRSQRTMLQKQGRAIANLSDEALKSVFEKQLATARQWLAERQNFRVLDVQYRDVIENSTATSERVNRFLGGNLSVASMAAAVHPELYRQRKSALAK